MRRPSLLVVLLVLVAPGCRATSLPAGDRYTSITIQQAIRLAMEEAVSDANLEMVEGRRVSVTSLGFDEQSEVREYLRYLIGRAIRDAGGRVVEKDAEMEVELVVHVAGVDLEQFLFVPIVTTTRLDSMVDLDMVVRETSGDFEMVQPMTGVAGYEEMNLITIVNVPGSFTVTRDGEQIPATGTRTIQDFREARPPASD